MINWDNVTVYEAILCRKFRYVFMLHNTFKNLIKDLVDINIYNVTKESGGIRYQR